MEAALSSWSASDTPGYQSLDRAVSNRKFAALVGCSHKTIGRLRERGMPDPEQDIGAAIRWYVTHVASKRAGAPSSIERQPKLTARGNVSGYGANSAKQPVVGSGMLIGWQAIGDYMGVHPGTAARWRRREGLPAGNLPDGRVAISLSLIDQWLMARYTAQLQERTGASQA